MTRNLVDEIPDWHDLGRRVIFKRANGEQVKGSLDYDDMTPGPDEMPIFLVLTKSGEKHSIFDFDFGEFDQN